MQDLKTLVVENLNPLSPEVISRQATINIGMQMFIQANTTELVRYWLCLDCFLHVYSKRAGDRHSALVSCSL